MTEESRFRELEERVYRLTLSVENLEKVNKRLSLILDGTGTAKDPGAMHSLLKLAEIVLGENGRDGLEREVRELQLERVRIKSWIAGASAMGGVCGGAVIWIATHAGELLKHI